MPEHLVRSGLRPAAGLPPGARKRKIFRQRREAGFYRVPFDVVLHFPAFFIAADQAIVAFILPKGDAMQVENPNCLVACKTFERSKPLSRWYVWRDEQMHVIRHHHE